MILCVYHFKSHKKVMHEKYEKGKKKTQKTRFFYLFDARWFDCVQHWSQEKKQQHKKQQQNNAKHMS